MTPLKIRFTDLELDPAELVDRVHHGVIPADWYRYRFFVNPNYVGPIPKINRWLTNNIDGRWAIFLCYVDSKREITIAFEKAHDGAMFVISDGAKQACEEEGHHL